jgi:hypothetical protein
MPFSFQCSDKVKGCNLINSLFQRHCSLEPRDNRKELFAESPAYSKAKTHPDILKKRRKADEIQVNTHDVTP